LSRPARGWIYELDAPGVQATGALILSEDDWNEYARDPTVVPIYEYRGAAENLLRVRLDDERVADCTRIQALPESWLGPIITDCPGDALESIEIGIRIYLDLTRLMDRRPARSAGGSVAQGSVYYAHDPRAGKGRMNLVMSDDDWNAEEPDYVAALALTSKRKEQRRQWEVPVSGGCVVAPDLRSLPIDDIDVSSRRVPPRPTELSSGELAEVARRLVAVLEL
jgi:mRNA-degrading endonuclease toxin of MazEF toxin-antitoxin module